MKYRIYSYTLHKTIRKEINTTDLESERKKLEAENPGFKVRLSFETVSIKDKLETSEIK